MTHSDSSSLVVRGARVAVWIVVPIVAVVLLRLFPPLELASNGELVTWLGPASAALVALCAAASTLLALVRGFRRDGLAGDLFAAAGLGALAAGAAAVALGGPDAAAVFPTAILPIAVVAAGLALLAAEVVPPVAVSGRLARLAAAALIFAWIEVPPAIGLLVKALTDLASPIAGAGAALLGIAAVTAAIGAPETRRAGWLAAMAASALALSVGRTGSADLLAPTLALAIAGAAAARLPAPLGWDDESDGLRPVALLDSTALADRAPSQQGEELRRLARELRGTIAELLGARQTVELQRDELDRLRTVDPLTGVATRAAMMSRLHIEVADARRYAHPCALVMIDLDGMAGLNRQLGRDAGDAVLSELALRLRLRVREADAIGRTDGDTFLAILPHTDERGATVFADAVRSRLTAKPVETNDGPVAPTVSIGITILRPGDQVSEDEVIGRVEEAVASARAAGGNRIAFDRSHGLARLEERGSQEEATSPSDGPSDEASADLK
jgi:diguanylate cyclase (GGDEF)-like protein